ncbi:hypothetical protein [Chamaesiphon sp. OTE_75_metabat_556]|uniref:hypothetical protein n=1 Tax=Chamaesiphon sp. OTE_75_metabat_556 TaxID=2964692 RepID=UPI00286D29C9|nr:hypothetical protein [Chamaesiphon sp. OTE_75_metabat_556]
MNNNLFCSTLLTFIIANTIIANPCSSSGYTIPNKQDQIQLVRNNLANFKAIDISRTYIGKIKLGDSMQKVISILGQPKERDTKNVNTGCIVDELVILRYKNLDIIIDEGGYVSNIDTTNPAYSTTEGIHVGNSIGKFKKAYQRYQYDVYENEGITRLRIYGENFAGLDFNARQGKIISINASLPVCD